MIQGKLIELLKTFSAEEFRQFGLLAASPFFNKEKTVINFYSFLKKYYPHFEGTGFQKQKAFAKLYPGKPYNDGVMRNVISKTLTLAETYLAVKDYNSSPADYNMNLMKELAVRRQAALFKKAEALTAGLMQNEIVKDEEYYRRKVHFHHLRRTLVLSLKSTLNTDNDNQLTSMHENISLQFLIAIFKSATFIMNTPKKMYSGDYDVNLLSRLDSYLNENMNMLRGNTYLRYYYNTYKLAATQDEAHFYELKSIMKNNYNELGTEDKRNIYSILTNYCYVKISGGEDKFAKEHFELIREHIEKGYYLVSGRYMTHLLYMNSVIVGLRAGETGWTERFMESHKADLDEANRENAYRFSKAFFYYTTGNYSKALDTASLVETNDLSYKHQLKSFYLKIYYDMNETEPFYSHVDNYRHFISGRDNAAPAVRETIHNYINYTKRLFDIKNSSSKNFELEQLLREVKESHSLINKEWLLKKIAEVKI